MNPTIRIARIAGILYLIIIVAGIFAEFFVRGAGDTAATAAAIETSEAWFRSGIAADLIMILSDVALALVLYVLFRPVSRALSLLAAFFRLVQAAILGVNLLNLFLALHLLAGAEPDRALALAFLETHGVGYSLGLVFFAFSLLVLGHLVVRSRSVPRLLGTLLVVAGIGYLVDSFALVLMPNYASYADLFGIVVFAPAIVAELSFALWLLFRGVRTPRAALRAPASA